MKKRLTICCILLDLLALGLVPLNLFLLSFPEWAAAAASLLILSLSVYIWIKGGCKAAVKIAASVANFAVICIVLFAAFCNPYWNSRILRQGNFIVSENYSRVLSVSDARRDLNYAMKYLKKLHPALLGGLRRSWSRGIETLYCR